MNTTTHHYAPTLDEVQQLAAKADRTANLVAICCESDAGDETPTTAFLKIRRRSNSSETTNKEKDDNLAFIFELSEKNNPIVLRHSIVSAEPWKVMRTGPGLEHHGDPLVHLERELANHKVASEYRLEPEVLNGAAFGYISYDCIRYFEPRVDQYAQPDTLQLPESMFMFVNSFIAFDHATQKMRIVALCSLEGDVVKNYALSVARIEELRSRLAQPAVQFVDADPTRHEGVSNVGKEGYEGMVRKLRERIIDGDFIQVVPSQRIARKIGVHPFNVYQQLRKLNPSRYTFYVDCDDFQLVGSSPEMLVQVYNREVTTHPIAGTRRRGKTPEEDDALMTELLGDIKERAEHIMLVDLGRNDINRVCVPTSTNLDALMIVEKYSHVMHIVSHVSGKLRDECSPFDAFRSIFPAGTVSGAPKVKAMEWIATLEKERRNVYAGAVGYFAFTGDINTCIAIRTMTIKDNTAYLQAGGGIVYDSEPDFEYWETVHKMAALARAIDLAEENSVTATQAFENAENARAHAPAASSFNTMWTDAENRQGVTGVILAQQLNVVPQGVVCTPDESKRGRRTLMIDNYDSFTWNLYQYLSQLGQEVIVHRNDKITLEECLALAPDRLVISPGPGWPKDAGVSSKLIRALAGKIPILGVCLGHECMVEEYGGVIEHCGEIVHGKTSNIIHDGKGLYVDIPNNVPVIRYHSLAARHTALPPDFVVTSKTAGGVIMGIRHTKVRMEGVQFHPESIKTDDGMTMLKNFVSWTTGTWSEEELQGPSFAFEGDKATSAAQAQLSAQDTSIRQALRLMADQQVLTSDQIIACIQEIMSGTAPSSQVGAFLFALRGDRISPDVLLASAKAMSSFAIPCAVGGPVIDVVGTGGDSVDTFNASTAAAFVVAAAGGRVAKHGNRSSSGRCGAADFMEALGACITLNSPQLATVIEECDMGFLFAQVFHPAMKSVSAIRRELGIRTIFNILGPLTNPASPTHMLVGVGSIELGDLYAQVLLKMGKQAMVVHSDEGLDEISPCGPTQAWVVKDDAITRTVIKPEDFGLRPLAIDDIRGSAPSENAALFRKIVAGKEHHPVVDYVALNAGAALFIGGLAETLAAGVALAQTTIKSGKVAEKLDRYIRLSQQHA